MTRKHRITGTAELILSLVVACSLIPVGRSSAQGVGVRASTVWTTATGYLGIENFRCNCTISDGSGETPRKFVFRSAPVVLGVASGGPAAGILLRGDIIIDIDGHSLLSAAGARRFAEIEPGDDVSLTVKRSGRTLKTVIHASDTPPGRAFAVITPEAETGYTATWDYPGSTPVSPAPPAARVAPAPRTPSSPRPARVPSRGFGVTTVVPAFPAQPPTPAPGVIRVPEGVWAIPAVPATPASPSGWFGFSIRCNDCGWSSSGRPGASPVWESEDPPELSMVSPDGPAGRAGLHAGDRITHIDGVSILSREGARKFGSVEPGQRVRLRLRRGASTLTRSLVLGTRPEIRAAIAARAPRTPVSPAARRELRYTGTLENVLVEVWSPGGPSVEKIGDTMVITVGSSIVRIKVDPKKARD